MTERPVSQVSGSILLAANTPLPGDASSLPFGGPRASYLDTEGSGTPRLESPAQLNANDSSILLGNNPEASVEGGNITQEPAKKKNRLAIILLASTAALIIVVLAIILPVFFTIIKPKQHTSTAGSGSGGLNGPQPTVANPSGTAPMATATSTAPSTSGGDGSTVRASDGTTFTYQNQFGGICEYFHLFSGL